MIVKQIHPKNTLKHMVLKFRTRQCYYYSKLTTDVAENIHYQKGTHMQGPDSTSFDGGSKYAATAP